MLADRCISLAEGYEGGSFFSLCGQDWFYRLNKLQDYTKKDLESIVRRFKRMHDRMHARDIQRQRELRKLYY